jgi:mono/diheme cytochrome c family protein
VHRRFAIALAIAFGVMASPHALAAQQPDSTHAGAPPDSLLTPEVIDMGRQIFHGRGTCHGCHGSNLQGGPIAPALTGQKWRHIDGTWKAILDRVENGLKGSIMPAHPGRINDAQVHEVAAYVYAVSHGLAKP